MHRMGEAAQPLGPGGFLLLDDAAGLVRHASGKLRHLILRVAQRGRGLITQLTTLFRKEVQLARTEVSEKITEAVMAIGFMVGGAVLLIASLVLLLQAAVDGLVNLGLNRAWAALIVGGVVLLIGIVLVWLGSNRLKAENLAPRKTVDQLQRDAAMAKEQVR